MNVSDYSTYELEDFLSDESFQNWVFQKNKRDVLFWEEWIEKNVDKKPTVELAHALLSKLRFEEEPVSEFRIQQNWQQLTQAIVSDDNVKPFPAVTRKYDRLFWTRVAAVFAGVVLVTVLLYNMIRNRKDVYQSDFGEMITLTLPDGSKAVLNGNSTLSYAPAWEAGAQREVWLNGEAFFSVIHTANHQKFTVHISGDNEVEVLGTEFNVSDRESRTRVVLSSGKVRFVINDGKQPRQIIMKPGELVEVSEGAKAPAIKNVNPDNYIAWKNKQLVFDNTPFQEIAQILQDTYGLEVTIADQELANKQVSGTIPVENVEVLLDALAVSFQLKITRDNNRVIFENK